MDKQRDNLKNIEALTTKLTHALKKIDEPTRRSLESNNLVVSGISITLQRVQIGIDKALNDKPNKPLVIKAIK